MLTVTAFQIAESIDIKKFKIDYTGKDYYFDPTEVYYVIEGSKYFYVLAYGVVAFIGYDEIKMSETLDYLKPYCKNYLDTRIKEEFKIHENNEIDKFNYNDVFLTKITADVLRIVMLNVAQSVAIDYFTQQAEILLDATKKHSLMLEKYGKLDISGKNLKKFIGKTLNVKNRIIENLYILDSPDATWEDEYLRKVDNGLKSIFDIKVRYKNLDFVLQIVQQNLELFKDLMYHRESKILELIIIVLILVEVVNLFIEKIFK